ncbi:neuroblastoma-amplified sequence, partial [Mytilus galloprovincialis]
MLFERHMLAEFRNVKSATVKFAGNDVTFTKSLAIEEIEERVKKKNIVPTLISQPEEFAERMMTSIYPDLDGTDHTTLIYYFTLLAGVGDVKQGGITADNHLKLLKKLKGVAIGLDCKQLMNGLSSPVKYIIPVLTPTNVTAIAKLANKIPDGTGGFLHPSVVHCAWAVKQFWSTDTKKVPDSTAAWVHRYEGSGESLQKLLPVDVINFIDEIVFSEQSRLKLEVECRQEIVKRTLKFTKQHGGKKKKQDDSGCRISWEDAANTLQQYLNHIENLNHESFKSLSMSGDDMLVEYAAKFDLSKGDNLQMQKLYCDMIENGYTVELIEDIMEVFPVSPWTPHTALKEAVGHLIQLLRDPDELDKKQILARLEKVVLNVEEHQNQGGNLVSSEDVMVLLRPFCSDDRVAVQPRLDVLHMVEKSFQLSEEDLVLLTLYRTEAVVKATWSDTQLKECDINTDKARHQLFLQLLSKSSNYNHFNSICDLLQLWPPLKAASSSDHEQNVWVNIFCAMINTTDSKTVSLVVTKFTTICDSVKLDIKCVRHVYNKMIEKKYTIEGVKFVLLSTHKDMLSAAVTELAALDEAKDDEELFDLLLKRSLLPQIVNTVYYKPVVGYLLANQNVEEQSHDYMFLKTVANQLNDNGFKAEAGSLMLQSRSAHSMLQTFGSALGATREARDRGHVSLLGRLTSVTQRSIWTFLRTLGIPIMSAELLVVNYHGRLKSYLVDRDKGFQTRHHFLFNHQYPLGISFIVYYEPAKILLVGGLGMQTEIALSRSMEEGVTAWRILSDYPYYKMVTDYKQDLKQDGVFKLCISPDDKLVVGLHYSGKLTIWRLPSLKLYHCWGLEEQSLILSRCTGAVTVSSTKTLKNLLGTSPEWFEPSSRVTGVHHDGFLGLEVECVFPQKRRLGDTTEEEFEDSDDEDTSFVSKTTKLTKDVLYYVTDMERFQPPRKRPKIINRTYRLVCLKSTTPEELYTRKIDHEEYGEALELAKAYGLDTDRVYQRQWKKSDVSIASIQDYLSKIKKRSWVFHECIEIIPYNIDAMRELLEFGLKGTDLQALLAIEKGEDGGRFILCDPEDGLYEDISLDEFDPETQTKKEELKKAKQEEMLNELEFKNLNLEQREVCRVRRKLLQYLYRLKTYECILGGVHAAAERFNEKFFQKFRSENIVETAVNYARDNNIEALETLFTFHWEDLRPHRLGILSNFPETTNPHEYRSLLPEVGNDKSVIPWEEDRWREKDWSEEDFCRTIIEPVLPDLGGFLYEENQGLKEFRMANPNTDDLSKWYGFRACEIERFSRQVDLSVELVKLATERGVEGLSELLDNLVTMEMLVYDCYVDENLTFDELQKMADYDKLELIMSKATTEMYTKCLHKWLVPFLQQCEHRQPGTFTSLLRDYIVTKAKTDLTLPTKIFEASKAT